MAKIAFANKVTASTISAAEINKVTAANMNEIKVSVNQNVDDIVATNQNSSIVSISGTTNSYNLNNPLVSLIIIETNASSDFVNIQVSDARHEVVVINKSADAKIYFVETAGVTIVGKSTDAYLIEFSATVQGRYNLKANLYKTATNNYIASGLTGV